MPVSKTILVTGATRGLGRALSKLLIAQGHHVIMTGRDEQRVRQVARELGSEAPVWGLDVQRQADAQALAEWLTLNDIRLDALVNNAGRGGEPYRDQPAENPLDTDPQTVNDILQVNLLGTYRVTQTLLPCLRRDRRADIVNISSGMGSLADMGLGSPGYRLSKAGVNALTRYLAVELAETSIHVNSVCPGWCRTDLGSDRAPRSAEEGVDSVVWLLNEEPDFRGAFIRDREPIGF
ncbi:SDR family NAD(P)-dependent oxidoreductase [Marinobacteraceae bacterium S3BR75-40.1]